MDSFASVQADASASTQRAQPTPLTAQVRALYEDSVVPVREIARLAGVSERTLYKYVAKGGWRRRHVWLAREDAAAAADRGGSMRPMVGFAPVKGAGGRFIAREQARAPHASGLKALDPQGARRAAERCARAGVLAHAAEAQAVAAAQTHAARIKAERESQAQLRALDLLTGALLELAKWECEEAKQEAKGRSRDAQRLAGALADAIFAAMERVVAPPVRREGRG